MTTLRERILKAAEFDVARFLYRAGYDNDRPLNSSEEWCVKGGESANLQLRPLIEALAAVVETVDQVVARYEDAEIRNANATLLARGCSLGVKHVLEKALANLERVVGK